MSELTAIGPVGHHSPGTRLATPYLYAAIGETIRSARASSTSAWKNHADGLLRLLRRLRDRQSPVWSRGSRRRPADGVVDERGQYYVPRRAGHQRHRVIHVWPWGVQLLFKTMLGTIEPVRGFPLRSAER